MLYDIMDPRVRTAELQKMLRYLSYTMCDSDMRANVTGVCDSCTENAIRCFQKDNNMPVTGVCGLDMWNEVCAQYYNEVNKRTPPMLNPIGQYYNYETVPSERSDTVTILQVVLNALRQKYDYDNIPISGVYGRETGDAVKRFQKVNLLPSTGIADRATWGRLCSEFNALREK